MRSVGWLPDRESVVHSLYVIEMKGQHNQVRKSCCWRRPSTSTSYLMRGLSTSKFARPVRLGKISSRSINVRKSDLRSAKCASTGKNSGLTAEVWLLLNIRFSTFFILETKEWSSVMEQSMKPRTPSSGRFPSSAFPANSTQHRHSDRVRCREQNNASTGNHLH